MFLYSVKIHSESLKSSAYKVLVRTQSTAPQFGVHSQTQISLNLKLSNIELPDGSNTTIDILLVPYT